MRTRRFIEIKHVGRFRYAITKQTHRGKRFSNTGSGRFIASNGVELYSIVYPEVVYAGHADFSVILLGTNRSRDKDHFQFTNRADVDRFKAAVKEYNKFHGRKR